MFENQYKRIYISLLVIFIGALIISCSKNDDSNISETTNTNLNSINHTYWKESQEFGSPAIYFSKNSNEVEITQPALDGSNSYDLIKGTFTYTAPTVNIVFTGKCINNGFIFSNCNISGIVSKESITISDNGKLHVFYWAIPPTVVTPDSRK